MLCSFVPGLQRPLAQHVEASITSPLVKLQEMLLSLLQLIEDPLLKLLLVLCHYSKLLSTFLGGNGFHFSQASPEQLSALELCKPPLSSIKCVAALIRLRDPLQEGRLFHLSIVNTLKEGYSRSQRPLVETLYYEPIIDAVFESFDSQSIVPDCVSIAQDSHTVDIASLAGQLGSMLPILEGCPNDATGHPFLKLSK
jgi:hypothetical protein